MSARTFHVHGVDQEAVLDVDITRCFHLSFTMRDRAKMLRHLEEIYEMFQLGTLRITCDEPPLVLPVSPWTVLTDTEITVQKTRTSGEVEIVTVVDEDRRLYVTVGSDHTDRSLEAIDIPWAKQVTPDVVAPAVWRWEDVADHWDDVTMECTTGRPGGSRLHQRTSVAEFWTPVDMVAGLASNVRAVGGATVLFGGTSDTVHNEVDFADTWTISLIDPVLRRRIDHMYSVTVLATELVHDGYGMADRPAEVSAS